MSSQMPSLPSPDDSGRAPAPRVPSAQSQYVQQGATLGRGSSNPTVGYATQPQQPVAVVQVVQAAQPQPQPPQPPSLRVPASILIRKDQVFKVADKSKTIHIVSRLDLRREMEAVNSVIAGVNLVDSRNRAYNPGLAFQLLGTHWVLDINSEVEKFAEEDILLTLFDVFFNAGYEIRQQYDQTIKTKGQEVWRESWLFQRVRPVPVFMVAQ